MNVAPDTMVMFAVAAFCRFLVEDRDRMGVDLRIMGVGGDWPTSALRQPERGDIPCPGQRIDPPVLHTRGVEDRLRAG